jgi:asparagine N-glycosylation enzyme membrane subunit Stt3
MEIKEFVDDVKEEVVEVGYSSEKKLKEYSGDIFKFIKLKFNWLIYILFTLVIGFSTFIRTRNLHLLKDVTTGKYIPLALDPFYFLRVAETIKETAGNLPLFDFMRQPSELLWISEILPSVLVFMHKIMNFFGDYSLQFVSVIYPVVFFALGLIVFFFLISVLTKSKITALLSSILLAFIPSYLYRTMAGFADHEAIGMFAFFSVLLCYTLALKFIEKSKKLNLIKSGLFGLLVAFVSASTIVSWAGIATFVFMIIPLGFFLFWIINLQFSHDNFFIKNSLLFYSIWLVFSILFGILFGSNFSSILGRYLLSTTGLISLFVLGFIFVDYFLISSLKKGYNFLKNKEKYRILFSIGLTIIIGILFLILSGKNIFSLISEIWNRLLHPFGEGRVGLTVAENKQPYLMDWISQAGKTLFWMFFGGLLFLGLEFARYIKGKKNKFNFSLSWVLLILAILFSRISPTSLFNGSNVISQLFYVFGIGFFIWTFMKIYFKNEIKIKSSLIVWGSWMFLTMISVRSAIRLFFVITPFICFSAGFFIVKLVIYAKGTKEEISKKIIWLLVGLSIIGLLISVNGFVKSDMIQANQMAPSAHVQWQNSMAWVRENTNEKDIFLHWWDYGYWVQYLGERPTIADGGYHPNFLVHSIGRYVLTTPKPDTALSFMKTYNASYLLIDPTDLGKYSAYSKIGSDLDWDRFSYTTPFLIDKSSIRATEIGTSMVFQGGIGLDEDIIYGEGDSNVFIPGPIYDEIGAPNYKSYVGGIILETVKSGDSDILKQPIVVYVYNGNQIKIPLRYVYINGALKDFGSGIDSVFMLLPKLENTGQINNFGAGLYLSSKIFESLFAKLYLMDDPLNEYSSLELVHSEDTPLVSQLKNQIPGFGDFVYYNGFRGPIKIWDVKDAKGVVHEEFFEQDVEWGELDSLFE